jgi:hypothetical protein
VCERRVVTYSSFFIWSANQKCYIQFLRQHGLFLVFIVTILDKNKKGKCKQQFDVVSTKMFLFPLIIISQWTLNIEYSAARLGKVIA